MSNRLYRSTNNRIVGGVCGGLGAYLGIEPLIVRILFVVAALMFSGTGLAVYLLLWVFVPALDSPFATHDDTIRSNVDDIRETVTGLGRDTTANAKGKWASMASGDRLFVGGTILVGVGLLLLLQNIGVLGFLNQLWPIGVIAVGVLVLINTLKR